MKSLILLGVCVLLSAAASVFLKAGVATLTRSTGYMALITNPMIWVGAFFYAAAFLGYIFTLKLVPLSLAQPVITAGVSALTAIAAVIIFREQMLLINWVGLATICTGILFLFFGRV